MAPDEVEKDIIFEARVSEAKGQLKQKVRRGRGASTPISKQGYSAMDQAEKEALKEIVEEAGESFDTYLERSQKLWPAEVTLPPNTWRLRDGTIRPGAGPRSE